MTPHLPDVIREPDLPERVVIHEVGPRDGLQNESGVVPTEAKVEFVRRLARAGLGTIEVTSFVHPKWVPQLADAAQVFAAVRADPEVTASGRRLPVLVPNERGLDRALELGAEQIAVFGSATETFAARNLNRTVEASLAMFRPVVARATDAGVRTRGYLSMCWGDPWEGRVPLDRVVRVGKALLDMGCAQLSLGDTIGVATPGHVTALLTAFVEAGVPIETLAVHFHDSYGQALANTLAALRLGVTTVDASAGGLGGCPYAESATGNLATEDLVWMLHGLGIETGVHLGELVATSEWMADLLGRPSPSRAVQALAGRHVDAHGLVLPPKADGPNTEGPKADRPDTDRPNTD
ncbi:hydroxymethylglutaryl-CoA lyase [Streptomyces sp. SID3343]|uniref:hydroxymethylglutaryl-CoA lyase n=1 Tax=Streptomyces sp. SID3343 TaxID=2690260 RepID=UPI00136F4C89|nr:hydroxymethylglutaryl-CoA lyase [Streptomyces sp. SID3343]MYW05724.1 hydroxymethylglutaryl-CoA lyase [Streptomyces sp. SID3343]